METTIEATDRALATVYRLDLNGEPVCEVQVETSDWLPRPILSRAWLRKIVAGSLVSCFAAA